MGEHIVLDVDRLNAVSSTAAAAAAAAESPFDKNASSSQATSMADAAQEQHMLLFYPSQSHHHHHHHRAIDLTRSAGAAAAAAPPPLKEYQGRGNSMECIECRICQEEDETGNLEIPCACCGSLKYAHRKCVQRWCNEKGDTMCEICQQPFKSGYTSPVRPVQPSGAPNELGSEWGHQLDFRDPRFLAMAERHLMQEYDEYAAANASGAACCRSAALVLMALLLLRHTLAIGTTGSDEDASTFFTLFFLRAAGFLLPCYIMARAMNIIQRRRQRQEWSSTRSFSMLDASPPHRVPFLNLLTSRV